MNNHIENGVCPQVEGQEYNPIDPKCRLCTTKHEPTSKTSPVFYVQSVHADGNLCLPLKERLTQVMAADPHAHY